MGGGGGGGAGGRRGGCWEGRGNSFSREIKLSIFCFLFCLLSSEKRSTLTGMNLLLAVTVVVMQILTLIMLNKSRCHAHFNFQPIRLLDPGF